MDELINFLRDRVEAVSEPSDWPVLDGVPLEQVNWDALPQDMQAYLRGDWWAMEGVVHLQAAQVRGPSDLFLDANVRAAVCALPDASIDVEVSGS